VCGHQAVTRWISWRAGLVRPELIQVCADLATPEVAERELRALEDAAKVHPKATRRLLTLTRDAMAGNVPRRVIVQPAYEWLLSPE